MPLTAEGYMRPTYAELLEKQEERAKELFGNDIDTGEFTPLGKYIRLNVYELAEAYELNEKLYYSRFPNTAEGTSLDRLMPFVGLTRNPPTPARHNITIKGVAGETVPLGFLVDTDTGISFYLSKDTTIGENGTVTAIFEAEELGEVGNVPIGSIKNIVNPVAEVDSIEHVGIEEIGREVESDKDLRERFSLALASSGSGTTNSIRGEVLKVNGVYGCIVTVNETDTTDADGRPPRSFECYVLANDSLDQQIAEAIYRKKPIGIKTHGDVSVTVADELGVESTIKFSRSKEIVVAVKISIKINNLFPELGVEMVKEAVAKYINGLSNGEDVIRSTMYSCVHSVDGVVEATSIKVSANGGNYSEQNVTCDAGDVARTTLGAIEVEVV